MWAKKGHQKISVFWDPVLSAENRPEAPQKVHSGASGSQKAPQMEPNSDTFWVPLERRLLVAMYYVFSTFEGPRMTPKSVILWKTLLEPLFEAQGLNKNHQRQL